MLIVICIMYIVNCVMYSAYCSCVHQYSDVRCKCARSQRKRTECAPEKIVYFSLQTPTTKNGMLTASTLSYSNVINIEIKSRNIKHTHTYILYQFINII